MSSTEKHNVIRQIVAALPPDHQAFLQHTNGGRLEFLAVQLFGIDRSDALDFAQQIGFLRRFIEGISEQRYLPFAVDAGGSIFCYDLTRPTKTGDYPVLYWNIEYSEEPDDQQKLWSEYASGFLAFLARLRVSEAELALTEALRGRGWVIQHQPQVALNDAILNRYPVLPHEVSEYFCSLSVCHNASQNVWFLTPSDYARLPDDEGFAWNELERLSGESHFWDLHFPFLYAVHSDYDYLAVRLPEGTVVHGFAPFWEEPEVIAPDFITFLEACVAAFQSEPVPYPYSLLL